MEIARTSLWGFYCRKGASWTQITTDWEYMCGLKIIKSWRFYISKQKRSTIGQAIWTLFSCYLFQITFKQLSYQQLSERLSPIIYPKLPTWFRPCRNLHERSQFFLIVWKTTPAICTYRIKPVPARYLAHFFFHLISFNAPQNLKTPEGK